MAPLLKHLAIFISISPAIFYVGGYFYYSGYLSIFGLEETLLPLEVSQMLLQFFIPAYKSIWISLIVYVALFAASLLGIVLYFYFVLPKLVLHPKYIQAKNFFMRQIKRIFSDESKNQQIKRGIGSLIEQTAFYSTYNLFLTGGVITWLFIICNYYGCKTGRETLENFQQKNAVQLQLNGKNIGIIGCSSLTQLCGVYNYDSGSVEIDKMSSLHGAMWVQKKEQKELPST